MPPPTLHTTTLFPRLIADDASCSSGCTPPTAQVRRADQGTLHVASKQLDQTLKTTDILQPYRLRFLHNVTAKGPAHWGLGDTQQQDDEASTTLIDPATGLLCPCPDCSPELEVFSDDDEMTIEMEVVDDGYGKDKPNKNLDETSGTFPTADNYLRPRSRPSGRVVIFKGEVMVIWWHEHHFPARGACVFSDQLHSW
eukprot:g1821.t1